MTRRLFVCHANAELASTNEVVDSLESALDFRENALLTSSLPGYTPEAHEPDALRDALSGSTLVLALVSEASMKDALFNFELGVAWALGARIHPVFLGDPASLHLPWPLQGLPATRADEPSEWTSLIGELSLRLGLVPRPASSRPPEPEPEPEPELPPSAAAAQTPTEPPPSDVYARLPSCEVSLEAGRAASDCLFNRDEISDFEGELAKPLGRLVDSLGGSWNELSQAQDFDGWLQTTEILLRTLPSEARRVEDWYRLGFELATLHNIAAHLALETTDAAAEREWRDALERFLVRAEQAEIGYENLGVVLALLENLAGPAGERDLANIARSLEALRRYAVHADSLHTAA